MPVFRKILIANRGEIACRVIRTARRMGVHTVAVYSEADRKALHVAMADEAYGIGPAPAPESYLSMANIIEAAQRSSAEAIHPGYGFLSENADFAEACATAGIVFIGPPSAAIRAMGSKSASKELLARSGVPLVPGYHGAAQDAETFAAAAERIGYPVLLKASSGGGGKGMRVVNDARELEAAIFSAKREAASSFGDDRLLIEKYLRTPRHIEMQVFGDTQGNVISIFERDCSIQRRYQKVLEECPAHGLDKDRRQQVGDAACAVARAVGYVGAGTVEFISEGEKFYFMEMNTRLQVEHPVTEKVTGLDLVEWQLRVAAGEPLPKRQEELHIHGHAIEVRVYAEDPTHDFRPSPGTITHLKAPPEGERVRVDTGVRAGDRIGVDYDPMIAKLIVWDRTREAAVVKLQNALAEYEIAGVTTNLPFLAAIARHPAYRAAELNTGFIAQHAEELLAAPATTDLAFAAAAMRVLLDRRQASDERRVRSDDPWSPWNNQAGWRLGSECYQDLLVADGAAQVRVRAYALGDGTFRMDLPHGSTDVSATVGEDEALILTMSAVKRRLAVVRRAGELTVIIDGINYVLTLLDPLAARSASSQGAGVLTAPMPGRVTQILVENGAEVKRGAPLLVLEAMKMEYTVSAPANGKVTEVRYAAGDLVEEGAELVAFTCEENGR